MTPTPTTDELIKEYKENKSLNAQFSYHRLQGRLDVYERILGWVEFRNENGMSYNTILEEISKIKQALSSACENENSMQKQTLGEQK